MKLSIVKIKFLPKIGMTQYIEKMRFFFLRKEILYDWS